MNDFLMTSTMILGVAICLASLLIERIEPFEIVVTKEKGLSQIALDAWKRDYICHACKYYSNVLPFSAWVDLANTYNEFIYKNEQPKDMVNQELIRMKAYHG